MAMPLHVDDAATFYYNEKLQSIRAGGSAVPLLQPGAKMMLRLHLFELTNKLALYEQVD